jgi:hypothetical protein
LIDEAKYSTKREKLRKQVSENLIIWVLLLKIIKTITAAIFYFCQQLKSVVTFIQRKPILGILLRGFSLSSCPQHSMKVLFLLNPMCLF